MAEQLRDLGCLLSSQTNVLSWRLGTSERRGDVQRVSVRPTAMKKWPFAQVSEQSGLDVWVCVRGG